MVSWSNFGQNCFEYKPRMIRSKASVPHDIIQAEMGAGPIITEALFRSVAFIERLWELPKWRYPRLALMSSRQLAKNGVMHCSYAEMRQWFESHGMSINALPPFQYSLDCPHLNMTKVEKNRVIRTDIINLENKITWISPKISLGTKMANYKTHVLHIRRLIHHQTNIYGHTLFYVLHSCDLHRII